MNFALPATLILLILLPGFVVRSRFKRVEKQSLDFSPFGIAFTEGICWAFLLNFLWIVMLEHFSPYQFEPIIFFELLSTNSKLFESGITKVTNNINPVFFYFGSQYLLAILVPPVIKHLISKFRVDRFDSKFSWLFRFNGAPWYYLLSGTDFNKDKLPDLIYVSAIVDVAGNAYIYSGQLDEYYLDESGKLDRLILHGTKKRPILLDRTNSNDQIISPDRSNSIEGDYFVLRYEEAITLNIKYIMFTE
jgi:hypothetical protein